MIPFLQNNDAFPAVTRALTQPNGLLAAGGDLSLARLIEAYQNGIFPWFSPDDPILWWSPDPRMVLFPHEFKLSKSLKKILRKGNFEITTDCAFEKVMRACAAPRSGENGTWIAEEIIAAYCALHNFGYAHSVEVWIGNELAGGLYGVAIGKMFYGESMFSRRTDGSKIAFAHMAKQFERWGIGMLDCQMYTPHLASLGAREIPRAEFIARLQDLINCESVKHFRFDTDLF